VGLLLELNATQVRNEWSTVVDSVVREKPVIFKRTRDRMVLSDIGFINELLTAYVFHVRLFTEDNGSVTASLDELDIVENGETEHDAKIKLAESVLEYAEDYYNDFSYWSRGDRKSHIPYVFKALFFGNADKIGGAFVCRHGEI